MEVKKTIDKLEGLLNKIAEKLEDYNKTLESAFKSFEAKSPQVDEIVRRFVNLYVEKLQKKIDYTLSVISAPICIAFLGRYSHGKTALVNALFDIPQDYSLPEGEGVVTSKIGSYPNR